MFENIYFVSSIIGLLISLSLILQGFTHSKANFFMGLVVLVFSFELLFSWGTQSGYNNDPESFPIGILLNYQIFPPAIWLFAKFHTDDNFSLRSWHFLLFITAFLQTSIEVFCFRNKISLTEYPAWVWFSDYLPLLGFIFSLGYFWVSYYRLSTWVSHKPDKRMWLSQIRLIGLMASLSLIGLLWLIFTFVGWQYFNIIELVLVILFLGLTFLIFLESQTFSTKIKVDKSKEFPNYDDQKQLKRLNQILQEEQLFLKPNLSLKEVSEELNLPYRYVSFLINHYHSKNYREFINDFRIDAFLIKARSGKENYKTLLALALESGFSSKSTFNQVFKNRLGKSPSEYLTT